MFCAFYSKTRHLPLRRDAISQLPALLIRLPNCRQPYCLARSSCSCSCLCVVTRDRRTPAIFVHRQSEVRGNEPTQCLSPTPNPLIRNRNRNSHTDILSPSSFDDRREYVRIRSAAIYPAHPLLLRSWFPSWCYPRPDVQHCQTIQQPQSSTPSSKIYCE